MSTASELMGKLGEDVPEGILSYIGKIHLEECECGGGTSGTGVRVVSGSKVKIVAYSNSGGEKSAGGIISIQSNEDWNTVRCSRLQGVCCMKV